MLRDVTSAVSNAARLMDGLANSTSYADGVYIASESAISILELTARTLALVEAALESNRSWRCCFRLANELGLYGRKLWSSSSRYRGWRG